MSSQYRVTVCARNSEVVYKTKNKINYSWSHHNLHLTTISVQGLLCKLQPVSNVSLDNQHFQLQISLMTNLWKKSFMHFCFSHVMFCFENCLTMVRNSNKWPLYLLIIFPSYSMSIFLFAAFKDKSNICHCQSMSYNMSHLIAKPVQVQAHDTDLCITYYVTQSTYHETCERVTFLQKYLHPCELLHILQN